MLFRSQKIAGEEALIPESAILVGSCRALNQEYANVSCRGIDIVLPQPGSVQEDDLLEGFLVDLVQDSADSIVAYRGGQRWVQTFDRLKLAAIDGNSTRLRQGGVYVITGGLGRVGLAIAEHLARIVQAKLVLIGRSGLPPAEHWNGLLRDDELNQSELARTIWQILAIKEMGSEVLLVSADVSNVENMREAIAQTLERFGTINGVFHAARLPRVEYAHQEAAEAARSAFAPKIAGLIVLEEVLKDVSLDFLLLISSITAVTGRGPGQVEICSANAYLDAYAHARYSRKRPVLSINWGEWNWGAGDTLSEGVSPAAQEQLRKKRERYGIRCEEGMDALSRILESGLPQVVVSTQDLHVHCESAKSRFVPVVCEPAKKSRTGLPLHPRPELGTSYVVPTNDLERKVAEIWQDLLGIDEIGTHDNFFELGGHSLLATRLFARIRKEFQISLSLRSIFEMPTIASQSEMISALVWMDKDLELHIAGGNIIEGEIA